MVEQRRKYRNPTAGYISSLFYIHMERPEPTLLHSELQVASRLSPIYNTNHTIIYTNGLVILS